MQYSGYELMWMFFIYSFLGWLVETAVASGKQRKFVNRGFFSGPVCFIYGVSAILLTIALEDLRGNLALTFLGSLILATAVEWLAGKMLHRMNRRQWWDYSNIRWNFDGYICIPYSILWGVLGTLALRFGNEVLAVSYSLLPTLLGKTLVIIMSVIAVLDCVTSLAAVHHSRREGVRVIRNRIGSWTYRLGIWLLEQVESRMENAYPTLEDPAGRVETADGFAPGCGPAKMVWLFVIAALLGDLLETVFCRFSMGYWMSRSSLVWGPFSIVWGLAIVLATALLYRDQHRPDRQIFLIGTVLGGAFEYLCSVLTELVFGKVFWDYSAIPFNLAGRINLLFCFFWGIAAVVWIKKIYPPLSRWIEKIPRRVGVVLTWILAVFMCVDMAVSAMALIRYDTRGHGEAASWRWEEVMDRYFDDARMEKIYPSAIVTD